MKKQLITGLCILLCSLSAYSQKSVQNALDGLPTLRENKPAQIMILGTFHFNFAQNGSDVKGENNFDITSEKSQAELNSIIEKIKVFKPTKIAVEMMMPDQRKLDSLYKAYLNGTWKLGRNETYQLGFRLAKELGLQGVSCVDVRPPQIEIDTTVSDWDVYAKNRNEQIKMDAYNKPNAEANAYMDDQRGQMHLNDYLVFLNDEKTKLRYKQFFLTGLVNLGAGDTYIGADLTGYWYRRNTRIFTNIKNLVQTDEERILVIYGNSHAWVLQELFSASPEFRIVKVENVLK
ncbi:MAG: DUF5694 domain-containing protein [Bacteroidota bacterium]